MKIVPRLVGRRLHTEAVEAERLDMVFEVRSLARRVALGEGTELARRHGHRAAPEERIFEADAEAAEEAVGALVERPGIVDLVGHAELQMVLQVLADAAQIMTRRDAVT